MQLSDFISPTLNIFSHYKILFTLFSSVFVEEWDNLKVFWLLFENNKCLGFLSQPFQKPKIKNEVRKFFNNNRRIECNLLL